MQIAYELTQKDFMEAFAAHRLRNSSTKWIKVILFWIMIAFTSYGLFGAVKGHNPGALLPLSLPVILWIVLLEAIPRWYVRRQFTKQPGAQGPRTLMLDTSGAHWRWNGGSADVEWRNYIRSVEGTNQILLYTSPACFNILPKRVLNPDQLAELRALLENNLRADK